MAPLWLKIYQVDNRNKLRKIKRTVENIKQETALQLPRDQQT